MVGRNIAEDRGLKLIDRGLLLTLLSLPDKWDFSVRGITKILPDGKAAINSSLDRLIKKGYIERTQLRKSGGKYGDIQIEVFDHSIKHSPCTENRETDKRETGKRVTENQVQLNKKEYKNNGLKNNQCYSGNGKDEKDGRDNKKDKYNPEKHKWTATERDLYGIG